MAIELPSALQSVLGLLGLKWPQADEDALVEYANELKKLASTIDSTQMAADKALTRLEEVYHGGSADKLAEVWANISKYSGMVVSACTTTANALNAAALVIETCKGETITQLTTLQAELAAASETGPWSTEAIIQMGKQIISHLLEEAVAKLAKSLTQPVQDLVDTAVRKVTDAVPGKSNGQGFAVDRAALTACAVELRGHFHDIDSAGSAFRRIIDDLHVGESGDEFGDLVISMAKQIVEAVGTQVLNRILGSLQDTADKMDLVVRNLTENEDSHAQQLNGILGSQTSTLFSPKLLQPTGGTPGGGVGGGAADVGLAAFAALSPKLDGFGSGGPGGLAGLGGFGGAGGSAGSGGGHSGFDGSTSVLGGAHAEQPGGAAGLPDGMQPDGPSNGNNGSGSRGPLGTPISLGVVSGYQRTDRAAPRRDLGTAAGHEGTEQTAAARQSVAPIPGLMNPVPYGGAAAGGHQGSPGFAGFLRAGLTSQQRNERRSRRNTSPADLTDLLAGRPEDEDEEQADR